MWLLVLIYGLLALVRERLAICYYGAVYTGSARWASLAGFLIGILDCTVLVVVFGKIVDGWGTSRALIPLLVYEVCGAIGTYIGVKRSREFYTRGKK